jgi:tetratricopeptide (TPR) repeat protein
VLLTILAGVTVVAFFATRAIAQSNEAARRRQAAVWFDAAQQASQSGDQERAVAGLRRAVMKDPENRGYRLALAQALASNRLDEEARRVLLALRETQPDDPDTHLQLARLEARGPDIDAARRYYQSALAGLWRAGQAEERRRVRIELIEFLLAHQERARALSELLALSANLPLDTALQARVGAMFLSAGDPRLALNHFERAIERDPKNVRALAGAGEAAFELADYGRALRYLNAAPGEGGRLAELKEVASLVLHGDPLAPRLPARERRRRLTAGLEQAVLRLESCSSRSSGEASRSLESLREEVEDFRSELARARRGPDSRDAIDHGVDLLYRIERAAAQSCALPLAPLDRALLLIGRRHGFGE